MSQVKLIAIRISAYCETAGILPHCVSAVIAEPWYRITSSSVITIIASSTDMTCGIENLMRTAASTK
jgi:hypothetical protein